jgi:2-dehydropantoate 2-reductase
MAGSTGSMRSAIGAIRSDPELRGFFRALMQEAYSVGKAKGVALAPDFIDGRMKFLDTIEPGMKASMAHDLERGGRIELDWLAGKVRALGREYNIPTPASDTVYTVLKLNRMGSRP